MPKLITVITSLNIFFVIDFNFEYYIRITKILNTVHFKCSILYIILRNYCNTQSIAI